MLLRNGKKLVIDEYKYPVYNPYNNELVGYEYNEKRKPRLDDVYIGPYDLKPECLRGLKWECYGIQNWHVCVRDIIKRLNFD